MPPPITSTSKCSRANRSTCAVRAVAAKGTMSLPSFIFLCLGRHLSGIACRALFRNKSPVPPACSKDCFACATAVVSTNGVSLSCGAEALAILWRGKRRHFHEKSLDKKHLRVFHQRVLMPWSKLCLRRTDKLLRCKPELDQQILQRRRRAKGSHPNDRPLQAGIMGPAQRRGLFLGDPCRHLRQQDVVTVVLTLPLKQFPGRHTHHTGLDPLLLKLFVGLQAQRDLTAGRQQQNLRLATVCICQDIGPLSDARGWGIDGAVNDGQGLSREDKSGWFMVQAHDHAPGLDDFIGISRP